MKGQIMTTEKPRSDAEYEALATAIEDGDYTVTGPATVHRGRPRKGEERASTRATTVRMPEATLAVLEEMAAAEKVTTSDIIRTAADEFIARRLTAAPGVER